MPELGLSEERLHLHLPLAHGFLVRLGRVVCSHLVQIIGIEGAMDNPPPIAFRAVRLEWASIAGCGIGPIDDRPLSSLDPLAHETMTFRAAVRVPHSVIG